MRILALKGREVLDSRGNPTVEAELKTNKGVFRAIVPSGASKGIHEALELRDKGKRYHGLGVRKAVKNVRIIAKKVKGKELDQEKIDRLMIKLDRTANKKRLGANAILAVSMAFCRAAAANKNIPLYEHIAKLHGNKNLVLPMPAFNVINGGAHASNNLDIQEYWLIPTGAKAFSEALQIGAEIYHELKNIIIKKYGKIAANVGDEDGYAPPMFKIDIPMDLILEAASNLGYKIKLGIDAAASFFYKKKAYHLEHQKLTAYDMIDKYKELVKHYPIIALEDPLEQDDFKSWYIITKELGKKIEIIGDDLLVTNMKRIITAIDTELCNALLLKPNQIGTVTEALEAAKLVKKHKWDVMVANRSGETEDSFIADLAVGIGCGQIKTGAPCKGERIAKYNQLLRIEENKVKFAKNAFKRQ